MAVAPLLLMVGCTEYRPVKMEGRGSWEQARELAYMRRHATAGGGADPGSPRRAERAPRLYVVLPGDTVSGLAARYGLSGREIIRRNRLKPPYHIYVGQILRLRDDVPRVVRIHRVRRGETLAGIAARYGYSVRALRAANPGIRPRRLRIGQELRLPRHEVVPIPVARAREEHVARIRKAERLQPPPLSKAGFLWPVRGEILDGFGAKPDGRRNDGINIAGRRGEPVRAAEAGVVVYAGADVSAFGRMLIIRHAGGYVTAYAHNDALLVGVGDVVRRGQVIARLGASGAVTRPQLHFQIRAGIEPVDPRRLLRPQLIAARTARR